MYEKIYQLCGCSFYPYWEEGSNAFEQVQQYCDDMSIEYMIPLVKEFETFFATENLKDESSYEYIMSGVHIYAYILDQKITYHDFFIWLRMTVLFIIHEKEKITEKNNGS